MLLKFLMKFTGSEKLPKFLAKLISETDIYAYPGEFFYNVPIQVYNTYFIMFIKLAKGVS